jgi:GWxTD domain-containing protein
MNTVLYGAKCERRYMFVALTVLLTALPFGGAKAQVAQVASQEVAVVQPQATRVLQMDVDLASFAYSDAESMLEVYMSFEAATMIYVRDARGFRSDMPVELGVYRSTQVALSGTPSDPVWADSLDFSFVIADTTGLVEGQHFVNQVRTTVPPGEYELRLRIPGDLSSGRSEVEVRRDLVVPDFSPDFGTAVSDIMLATDIERGTDRTNPFYKNGMIIRPNANQLYGSGLDKLFYYAEVYNAEVPASSTGKYSVFAFLSQANAPAPLPDLQKRMSRKQRSPDVVVGSFDISVLPSGSYFFRLVVLNEANESIAEQSRKFFVYNPQVKIDAPSVAYEESFENSQYSGMTEEEVEKAHEHIDIIATERERRRYKGLRVLEEKQRFLMKFWAARDPNTSTPINEFKDSFYSRVQYANDRYTTSFTEGWKTDRGHTLIKYGTPTGIEPHLFDRGFVPYELWEFNNIPGEGRSTFVFADLDGFGRFELVHSTVTGERKLANWQDELRQ